MEPSWMHFGSYLGAIFEQFWSYFLRIREPFWIHFGRSGAHLWPKCVQEAEKGAPGADQKKTNKRGAQ